MKDLAKEIVNYLDRHNEINERNFEGILKNEIGICIGASCDSDKFANWQATSKGFRITNLDRSTFNVTFSEMKILYFQKEVEFVQLTLF